ncbi:MAG: substrate-binding domain-containing protein, partial [Bacteroidota bacterium]
LKERGIVESKKNKGYFIVSSDTNKQLKIALLMYSFHRFQEEFYNTLREQLGEAVQIDVFFHHNNFEVFQTIFSNIYGKYGMYVVAPIENERTKEILKTIDKEKLIIVDRHLPIGDGYSYITQEFEKTTFDKLEELLGGIKNYNEIVLFFREDMDYPVGILNAFKKFSSEKGVKSSVQKTYQIQSVRKNTLYLFINDSELWNLLKDCKNNDLIIGKDVGILSFNEHIFKELVFGGITTISTDFKQMAREAAHCIQEKTTRQIVIPTNLRRRNSL